MRGSPANTCRSCSAAATAIRAGPWNRFSIRLQDAPGPPDLLAYEGNWRDIFQNWEALCRSYPEFFDAVIAKFLNASTPDGFNPYRISQAGIDWEVPDPEDPWSSIGYWGDHQVVYLLKLLEWSARHRPAVMNRRLAHGPLQLRQRALPPGRLRGPAPRSPRHDHL